jgi:hypothetical protein
MMMLDPPEHLEPLERWYKWLDTLHALKSGADAEELADIEHEIRHAEEAIIWRKELNEMLAAKGRDSMGRLINLPPGGVDTMKRL